MSKSNKPTVEHTRRFSCPECKLEDMTGPQFKQHLSEKHGITEIKGTKSLVLALDGDTYTNVYELTIGGKKFGEVCHGPK